MYNKIILVGNLTRDVEVRYSASNLAIGNTGMAVNRQYKNQMGEKKEEVLFVDLSFFGRTAEIANQYLRKGSKILVEGKLKLDQWIDTNGMKRSKHSITVESMQMLDTKKESKELEKTGYITQDYRMDTTIKTESTPERKISNNTEITFEESDIPF